MPPPLIGGAYSDDAVWRLSVAYIGPKSRTEMLRKTKIGIEVALSPRHTWLGHHFQGQKVKGQGHQVAVLARQAAAAVGVGTCGRGKLLLRLLGGARCFGAAHGEERGGGIQLVFCLL